jgi:hypothetical protein
METQKEENLEKLEKLENLENLEETTEETTEETSILSETTTTTNIPPFCYPEIGYIRDAIEKMSKFHQIKILDILVKNNLHYLLNENKYGVHVNLSEINPTVLNELFLYIHYVHTQENNLRKDEQQKEEIKNLYFEKTMVEE